MRVRYVRPFARMLSRREGFGHPWLKRTDEGRLWLGVRKSRGWDGLVNRISRIGALTATETGWKPVLRDGAPSGRALPPKREGSPEGRRGREDHAGLAVVLALLGAMSLEVSGADYVTKATQSGAANWTAAIWSNPPSASAVAPAAGNTYQCLSNGVAFGSNTSNTRLRNPATAGLHTFPGDSLTLEAHTEIRAKAAGAILNFPGVGANPGLILSGGALNAGDGIVFEFRGRIHVTSPSLISPGDVGAGAISAGRGIKFNAELKGGGSLYVIQAPTNVASMEVVSADNNTFTGGWIVKAGYLKGTGSNSLGQGNIIIDPSHAVSGSLVSATLATGPALFEPNYDLSTPGSLTLANGGRMILHQNCTFSAVTIQGTALDYATYSYAQLASQFANNFAAGGSGSITVKPPVAPPTGLTATGGTNQVRLSWSASAGATNYVALRATDSAGPYARVATNAAPAFADSGLDAGATYYYVVRAQTASGESPDSNLASALTAPNAPINLLASAGNNRVTLTWSATAGAASYIVRRGLTAGGPYSALATNAATAYMDTTVVNGTAYFYVVSALNATGPSGYSAEVSAAATAADLTPPLVVSIQPTPGLSLTSLVAITVTFSEPVTNVSSANLLMNGAPATNATGLDLIWSWTFPQPTSGPVAVTWAPGQTITDLASNHFTDGGSWGYTLVRPPSEGPLVTNTVPARGATVASLGQVVVTFNEPATGLVAEDLLVNEQPALAVTNLGNSYYFVVSQPRPGPVILRFDRFNSITDLAGHPLEADVPENSWSYTLLDSVAPYVSGLSPAAGAVVRRVESLEIFFNEAVTGVNAADLLVNGQAATNLTGSGLGPYLFTFVPPGGAQATFSWASGHGIADLASNLFGGGIWTNTLDASASTNVIINEFLAANVSLGGLTDEDGELQDWIELYNRGSQPVRLLGWSLSQTEGQPREWVFPDVTLDSGRYLVIMASGKDRRPTAPGSRLHTNFKLNSYGDYLALFNADAPPTAVLEFSPEYPEQRNDYSYGLNPASEWRYYSVPSPGGPNGDSLIFAALAPVHFSVERGFFNSPFTLLLTHPDPDALLRYTTDGSEPTRSNGFDFADPLTISGQTTLRAVAFKENMLPSLVQTHTYLFLQDVLQQSNVQTGVYTNLWGTFAPDYEMDPAVVNDPAYAGTIEGDLMALTTLSIVLKPDDMFGAVNGIYTHSTGANSGPEWTRSCSAELIRPDGRRGFQIDCGIRMQGGGSREESKEKKHPMALTFKAEYGPGKLDYPLFPDSPVTEFDRLVLRSEYNNHWTHMQDSSQRPRGTMIRDAWFRDLQSALGNLSPHSMYVHLYINGLYWGVYGPTERPDADFAAAHLGGEDEDYDAIHAGNGGVEVEDGDAAARNTMLGLSNQDLSQMANYEALKQYLDVAAFADYEIVLLYAGNADWDVAKNWWAFRPRRPGAGFLYVVWDTERSLEGTNNWYYRSPDNLQTRLVANPEYRLLFGDRAHRALFNAGALTPATAISTWAIRANQIFRGIVGESARWGDMNTKPVINPLPYPSYTPGTPYTRDENWLGELGRLTNGFMQARATFVLSQFRSLGLYPTVAAPSFSQHGGRVPQGCSLTINGATNTVYYTTNGMDPRVYGSGAVAASALIYDPGVPVVLQGSAVVKARALFGTNWSALNEALFIIEGLQPPLRITELMYNPPGGEAFEYFELRYDGITSLNVGDWTFEGVSFAFPSGTVLAPGQILVLANNTFPDAFAARYPGVSVFGWYGGRLDNAGERLALHKPDGTVVISVDYGRTDGWPAAANGPGYSIEILDPAGDPDAPDNWRATSYNGTPGVNPTYLPPTSPVRLSELMADNASAISNQESFPDWIELQNISSNLVDLGGWSLTDDSNTQKFLFPSNTLISGGGFLVVWCDTNAALPGLHTGFMLDRDGETVSLFDTATSRVDVLTYGLIPTDRSLGRVGSEWTLTSPTPDSNNVAIPLAQPTNVVINEWLANSPPGGADWLELYNSATSPVALRGVWLATSNKAAQVHSLSFLAGRGHVQLFADEHAGTAHLDITLPAEGGRISFHDAAGILRSSVVYGPQAENVAQGRLPDASANIVNFTFSASPGASNYLLSYTGPLLNEVMAANCATATNSAGRTADWIELYNPGSTVFDLSGFRLGTAQDDSTRWIFPLGATILGNGHLLVWCDKDGPPSLVVEPELNTGFGLDADSEQVYLFNAQGLAVDAVEFGPQAPDYSLGRAGDSWQLLASPSPGRPNSGPAGLGNPTSLRINEWLAGSPAGTDDLFELFNAGPAPVQLGRLYLSDDPSIAGQTKFQVATLSFIAPFGFTVFKADGNASAGRHHVNFHLDGAGESILIHSASLALINEVAYGLSWPGVSEGRLPDGAVTRTTFVCPTPGLSNSLAGVILLAAQPQGQTVPAGTDVSLSVSAVGGGALGYQWYLDAAILPQATNATLFLPNAQQTNQGDYRVRVANACAAATSEVARLTVVGFPLITTQPQSLERTLGETAIFTVTASSSSPLSYQWRHGISDLLNQTNQMLTLPAIAPADAGAYRVWVSNSSGGVWSDSALLTLALPPVLCGPFQLDANGARFSLVGQLFRDYIVEFSTALSKEWSNRFTVRLTNSPQSLIDPGATNPPFFYRARLVP